MKPNYSVGSSKPKASLYDDFELSYLTRSNFLDDTPLPRLEQETSLA